MKKLRVVYLVKTIHECHTSLVCMLMVAQVTQDIHEDIAQQTCATNKRKEN